MANFDSSNECLLLNEELSAIEKEKVIGDACRLNTITLSTSIFVDILENF